MSLEEQFNLLKSQLSICESELNSLKSGRKSSAPRLRKSLMMIKANSHSMRHSTTEYVKGLPTKPKKKKEEDVAKVEVAEPVSETAEEPKPKRKSKKSVE